jgi:dynein heavy chain, axonemal
VFIHQSVKDATERFRVELRRQNYTTPTSYLDLIKTYIEMLSKQKTIVPEKMSRYQNGLDKMVEVNKMVDDLKLMLIQLMPQIEEKSKATQEMVIDLEQQQESAAEVEKVTAVDEAAANKIYTEVSKIKSDCEAVLAEAMPALHKALKALDTLDKGDISEMKNYGSPPADLVLVFDAVCVMLSKKPSWAEAKQLMGNPQGFIDTLKNYDKDNIPNKIQKKIKEYLKDERFTPEVIGKKSVAGKSIC